MSRVTVTNPFDLLSDENEDRTNVPAPKKEQKPAAAPSKPAAKPAAATGATTAKPSAPKTDAAKAPAKTTGTHNANQTVKPAPPRDANQSLQEREKEYRPPSDKRDGPSSRQPRPAGDNKRMYDRKSGTGRPLNEVKKGGSGKGNWGEVDTKEGAEALKDKEDKPDDKDETEENKEEKVTTTTEGEKKEVDAAKEGTTEPAKELETRTLEEYLADKKKSSLKVEALKPRTVTDDEFKGLTALQRGEGATTTTTAAAKDKKEKKPKDAAAKPAEGDKKADKTAEKTEKNLAAKLLTFATHQDQKRSERPYRERTYDDKRPAATGGDRYAGGDRRPGTGRGGAPKGGNFRDNRAGGATPASPNSSSQPPVQEKDFPSLSPHGSDPVKA